MVGPGGRRTDLPMGFSACAEADYRGVERMRRLKAGNETFSSGGGLVLVEDDGRVQPPTVVTLSKHVGEVEG